MPQAPATKTTPARPDDAELVRRAFGRDEAAVRAIMQANNRCLYRLARGILHNDAEAEDVVQDTYVRAFRRPLERRTMLATITMGLLAMTAQSASAGPVQTDGQNNAGVAVRSRTAPPLLVSFAAGDTGRWIVDRVEPVIGPSLPPAARLEMIEGRDTFADRVQAWTLRGSTSNTRYTSHEEAKAMSARQEGLNRPAATRAALIPIRKTDAWWSLAQDERRAIFEEQSRHIAIGIEYFPAIARRLHHSRELGEPFDFLTWFEYAPEHSADFEKLVVRLRATPEWRYVDREVDIRLTRA